MDGVRQTSPRKEGFEMSKRLSPAARRSIRRIMRRRPDVGCHGCPLPPPRGTQAFVVDTGAARSPLPTGPEMVTVTAVYGPAVRFGDGYGSQFSVVSGSRSDAIRMAGSKKARRTAVQFSATANDPSAWVRVYSYAAPFGPVVVQPDGW